MEASISYITLGVSDLQVATAFYADALGLPLMPASNDQVSFFDMGSVRLALYPRPQLAAAAGLDASVPEGGAGQAGSNAGSAESPRPGVEQPGAPAGFCLSHNVRAPHQVDALLAHVAAHGGTLTRAGHDTEWGGYVGYFTDPDGFLWEIAWNPSFVHA